MEHPPGGQRTGLDRLLPWLKRRRLGADGVVCAHRRVTPAARRRYGDSPTSAVGSTSSREIGPTSAPPTNAIPPAVSHPTRSPGVTALPESAWPGCGRWRFFRKTGAGKTPRPRFVQFPAVPCGSSDRKPEFLVVPRHRRQLRVAHTGGPAPCRRSAANNGRARGLVRHGSFSQPQSALTCGVGGLYEASQPDAGGLAAAIGYFYLRLYDPVRNPSVLMLELPAPGSPPH